jgi:hypothetical protein
LASTCKKLCPSDCFGVLTSEKGYDEEMDSQGNPWEDDKEQRSSEEVQRLRNLVDNLEMIDVESV